MGTRYQDCFLHLGGIGLVLLSLLLQQGQQAMSSIYTIEYENADYRWWNPLQWFNRIETFTQETMAPITIEYRRKKILITADRIGHHLVQQCMEFDQ